MPFNLVDTSEELLNLKVENKSKATFAMEIETAEYYLFLLCSFLFTLFFGLKMEALSPSETTINI
jgi:hypothetical protein